VIDQYTRSKDTDLQQRCLEFQALLTTAPEYLGDILPVDASAEDVDVDVNLSFLDTFVSDALANGARAYDKQQQEDDDDEDDNYGMVTPSTAFKMTPYAKPEQPGAHVRLGSAQGPGGGASYSSGVTLPPGGNSSTTQQHHAGGMQGQPPPNDGLALNTRGVNVWGKKTNVAAAPPPAAGPSSSHSFDNNTQASNSSNPYALQQQQQPNAYGGSSSSGGGFGSQSSAYGASSFGNHQPPPPVEKSKEQLEKERQAAALFGGMVPGAPPPPPRASPPKPPAPPAAPAPPPPPAAPPLEIDLLDMGAFDDVEPMASTANAAVDIFSAAPPPPVPAPAAPPPPHVETVSDDEDNVVVTTSAAASAPAPMAEPVDPFAAEGLLSDLTDAPLKSFMSHSKFEYNGSPMEPLTITTAQFGQQWGSCHATSPASVTTGKISTLDMFMKEFVKVGLHPIEAIAATNEGICAGMINGGAIVILVHGKVSPLGGGQTKLDLTVKSTDHGVTGSLAMYLQNMMN
jgi:AP-4 complex subunit epsilon-1